MTLTPLSYTLTLIKQLNNLWKVDAIESGHHDYHQLDVVEGRKYLKIRQHYAHSNGRSVYMFVDKVNGFCYKPASWKSPAKGVRYDIHTLVNSPEMCDPYGSFLYTY